MAKTLFHCVAGLRGAAFRRVLQNDTVREGERLADLHAPADAPEVVAAVEAALAAAARNETLEPRYPASLLSPALRAHCARPVGRRRRRARDQEQSAGWETRVFCK